ncbi:MAG: N-acetylmuramoyl-L-alanine amidase [Clostridia bacterium]|nr:N-acetylmuramoyl-L-alanine amidase [Clostridia bacterium]
MKIIFIRKKAGYYIGTLLFTVFAAFVTLKFVYNPFSIVNIFTDPGTNIIVVDPGHGGIDGGATVGGTLEKDINLAISKKLKEYLEQEGYAVVLTREEDISLDKLSDSKGSRHQRDLNARKDIINGSSAQLFLSIHVNCNLKRPQTDSAIVFYSNKYEQNKELAYCIQSALNSFTYKGIKRTIHKPQKGSYFLLKHSNVPGVIVETAFLSNKLDRELLQKEDFRDEISRAIVKGVEQYLKDIR